MKSAGSARMTASLEGSFVVFLIGMRINRWWKPWAWMPVLAAMPRMLAELRHKPGLGLLHARTHFGFRGAMVVQYWRSFELLEAYARDRTATHLPAWKAFNAAIGNAGDVGIWHESFLVDAGRYEAIYVDMPAFGLACAGTALPADPARPGSRDRHLT